MERLFIAAQSHCGCDSWADIGRLLDESDQTMTNWKTRGIPKEKLLEIAEKVRVNPYWLRDGGNQPMVVRYSMDKDLIDLLNVAEELPHDFRQLLTSQGIGLAQHAKKTDKKG